MKNFTKKKENSVFFLLFMKKLYKVFQVLHISYNVVKTKIQLNIAGLN